MTDKPLTPEEIAERLGCVIRETWVEWAREQPDVVSRPDWLDPWEKLPERIKDVDRRLGLAAAAAGNAEMPRLIAALREAREDMDNLARIASTQSNELKAERDAAVDALTKAAALYTNAVNHLTEERDAALQRATAAEEERDRETARRKHMQTMGRYLAWGLVGPNHEPAVALYDDHGAGHDKPTVHVALYADHGGDTEATERAVVDKALAASQPQPPNPEEEKP